MFESNCLKKTLYINWYEHVTEEEVRIRSGQKSVIQNMRTKRWSYYGHVLRMRDERLPKQTLTWKLEDSQRSDRPKDIYIYIQTKELEGEDVECMAQQREDWRRLKADLWATCGLFGLSQLV